MPVNSLDAKLLYFLNLNLTDIDVAVGTGIFLNIDKAHGMRKADNSNSVQYGRLSLDDIRNRVPVKKDLFVICAAAAGGITADDMIAEMDIPIPGLESVAPWIPKLNIGGDSENQTTALQAITKKEISTRRGSRRSLALQPMDRRRLEASIPTTAHRGLRMLCSNQVLNLEIDCPVDTSEGEFACVKLSDIRLDINKIQELVEPIIAKLVNPPDDDAIFDTIAKPVSYLDMNLEGLSLIFSKGDGDEVEGVS